MNLHFINSLEAWIYFTKTTKTGTFNNNGKALHDYIESSITPKNEKRYGGHPTQKPESIMQFFVETLSNTGDVIMDPFMGSGTTGVVSKRTGRDFVGVELNDEYFNICRKRIDDEITQIQYGVDIIDEVLQNDESC
jgi:DNA modification methylase